MNGGEDCVEKPESRLDRMRRDMDEMLARKGVIQIAKPDVDHYLNITDEEMNSLPPDELGQMAFAFARYAYYIQTVVNNYTARKTICKRMANETVSSDPQEAREWRKLLHQAEHALEVLAYHTNRLYELSRAASEARQRQGKAYGKI